MKKAISAMAVSSLAFALWGENPFDLQKNLQKIDQDQAVLLQEFQANAPKKPTKTASLSKKEQVQTSASISHAAPPKELLPAKPLDQNTSLQIQKLQKQIKKEEKALQEVIEAKKRLRKQLQPSQAKSTPLTIQNVLQPQKSKKKYPEVADINTTMEEILAEKKAQEELQKAIEAVDRPY